MCLGQKVDMKDVGLPLRTIPHTALVLMWRRKSPALDLVGALVVGYGFGDQRACPKD